METTTPANENSPQKRFEIDFTGSGNLRHARAEDAFVQIGKEIKSNIKPGNKAGKDFTLTTLGLYTFIRMLPPNWEFSIKGLQAVLPLGRTAIQHEISILESHGYIIRVRAKDEDGKFSKKTYWVTVDKSVYYPYVLEDLKERGFYPYGNLAKEIKDV
jgi:hypothetical protein